MSVEWKTPDGIRRGPSWKQLVDQATKELGFDDPSLARVRGTDLQILEYFKIRNSGQTAKLTNWLTTYLNPPDDALEHSPIHSELAKLSKCKIYYTTNFDNFLERALRLYHRCVTVVAVEGEMGASDDSEIIKFHGDLDHPNQIVLTERDYENRLKLESSMDHRLRADLLGRVALFLGYSFRDPNVSYLFRLFTEEFFGKPESLSGCRAYIVVGDPSGFETSLFGNRNISVIPVRGEYITKDTADVLKDMRR